MSDQENQELYAQLERLPEQIRTYYDTYFSELRKGLASPDLTPKAQKAEHCILRVRMKMRSGASTAFAQNTIVAKGRG